MKEAWVAYTVDRDSFGPTGNMMRREVVRVRWQPLRSCRKHRVQAGWWRTYPRDHAEWYRGVLRRATKPKR